jgi:drug/metabolite transporter (DMT)-like permease
MMRLGAAFTVVYGIVFIVAASTYAKHHPLVSARDHLSALATWMVFATLVEAGLWLGVARACGRGKNPARITGTVLFGCYTLGTLRVLGDSHQWLASAKPLSAVGWVIACVAVVFLWQRPSSRFFRNIR